MINHDYPTLDTDRIDYKLAALLQQPVNFSPDMPHDQRVILLDESIILEGATMSAGWTRHTNDWDWECTVHTNDNREYLGYSYSLTDANGNSPQSVNNPNPDLFTACIDYEQVTHLKLEGYTTLDDFPSTPTIDELIPIDSITTITWEEL